MTNGCPFCPNLRATVSAQRETIRLKAQVVTEYAARIAALESTIGAAVDSLCCCPPGGDAGCGCRAATLPELASAASCHGAAMVARIAELEALVANLSTRLANASEALGRAAERQDRAGWGQVGAPEPSPVQVGLGVVHYAPYGRNALGTFDCGNSDGGYTDRPSEVTCDGCKAKSPGLWPGVADQDADPAKPTGSTP